MKIDSNICSRKCSSFKVYSLLVSCYEVWNSKVKLTWAWAEDHIIFHLVMHGPCVVAFGALATSEHLYPGRDTFEFDQGHDWPRLNQSQCSFCRVTVWVYNTECSSLLLLTKSHTMQKEVQKCRNPLRTVHFKRSIVWTKTALCVQTDRKKKHQLFITLSTKLAFSPMTT